jgi:hypothetical protein
MILLIIWIVGMLATAGMSAYFDWDFNDNPPEFIYILSWFIALPIIGMIKYHSYMKDLGKQHREKKKKIQNIRIAEEEKAKQLRLEAEQETEEFFQEINKQISR